jgi:hypothetical protein
MVKEFRADPILAALMKQTRLSWYRATAIVAAVLLSLLILVTLLNRDTTYFSEPGFWRPYLVGPVMITYILVVYPFMARLFERAIQAFRSISPMDESDFNRLVAEINRPHRRRELAVLFIGAVFPLLLSVPWSGSMSGDTWLKVYQVILSMLLFGLLGWLIYDTIVGTMRIARLSSQELRLDIFDTKSLSPIAVWSLGISLAWVGGISLSLVFQTWEGITHWQTITIYAILVSATVLVFFLSTWSTHNAIVTIKKRELSLAWNNLATASRELKSRTAQNQKEGLQELSYTITAWAAQHKLVKEISTWPFDASVIRSLAASMLAPIIIFLIKLFAHIGIS